MKTPTDEELKSALAKMMPDLVAIHANGNPYWIGSANGFIFETEFLHLCALVEKTLADAQCPSQSQWCQYIIALQEICGEVPSLFATWQQRATALAKVKGIEV